MFHQVKVDRTRRTRLCLVGMLLLSIASQSTWSAKGVAQEPYAPIQSKLPIDDPRYTAYKKLKDVASRNAGEYASNKTEVDGWYGEYLKSFTHLDELGALTKKRQEVLKDLRTSASRSPDFHQQLLATALRYMEIFAANSTGNQSFNLHPVTRYNAMLLLGQLNKSESAGTVKFPTAEPNALPILIRELKNKEQIDAVRIAALIGILRHARLDWAKPAGVAGIPLATRKEAISSVLVTVQADPPEGRSPEVHQWMRRRGIEVLGALKALGNIPQPTVAIAALVADEDEDLMVRCTAARSLRLYFPNGNEKLNLVDTAQQLAVLAVTVSRSELDWISEYQRKKATEEEPEGTSIAAFTGRVAGSAASAMEADEAAAMMGVQAVIEDDADDQSTGWEGLSGATNALGESIGGAGDPEVVKARRRILTKLVCIRDAMNTIAAAAAGTADEAKVKAVDEQLGSLLNSTVPPEEQADLVGLAKSFSKAVRELDKAINTATARADRAVPPAVPPGGNVTASTGP